MQELSSLTELLEQARLALSRFDYSRLEALAEHAGRISSSHRLSAIGASGRGKTRQDRVVHKLMQQHRLLQETIHATRLNLGVMRRLRGDDQQESNQWVR